MIGVDLIGQIRRAYFEQQPADQGDRAARFRVSRTTVRKVIRGQETEFKYERVGAAGAEAWRVDRGL